MRTEAKLRSNTFMPGTEALSPMGCVRSTKGCRTSVLNREKKCKYNQLRRHHGKSSASCILSKMQDQSGQKVSYGSSGY